MMALDGIKVLDFCRNTPGMFCSMVLADLGADVLMVERPMSGDRAEYERTVFGIDGPEDERRRAAYNALQRNKRSIALNLQEPEARSILYQLAETADVVLEGFRPGVMDRLGVGYQKVQEINARIIYGSISGYGQDGPYSRMAGHDLNYISFAGALGLVGHTEEDRPAIPLNLLADYAGGGLCGAVAVLAALLVREQTGRGQYLDIAMTDGVLYMLAGLVSDSLAQGVVPGRGSTRLNGGVPYYNVYRTKDDKYFTVAAVEPWFWRNLCTALGREDFMEHQHAEGAKRREIYDYFEQTFRTKTRDEWFELLKEKDISVGKVYSLDEVLLDPQVAHRGMVVEVEAPGLSEGTVKQVGIPFNLSETPGRVRHAGSVTGQHTADVLADLGYQPHQIEDLRQREVVQ